jgi:hypothetical protein
VVAIPVLLLLRAYNLLKEWSFSHFDVNDPASPVLGQDPHPPRRQSIEVLADLAAAAVSYVTDGIGNICFL